MSEQGYTCIKCGHRYKVLSLYEGEFLCASCLVKYEPNIAVMLRDRFNVVCSGVVHSSGVSNGIGTRK